MHVYRRKKQAKVNMYMSKKQMYMYQMCAHSLVSHHYFLVADSYPTIFIAHCLACMCVVHAWESHYTALNDS